MDNVQFAIPASLAMNGWAMAWSKSDPHILPGSERASARFQNLNVSTPNSILWLVIAFAGPVNAAMLYASVEPPTSRGSAWALNVGSQRQEMPRTFSPWKHSYYKNP